ncbi:hypothetical protein SAMN05660479_01978 [Microbulbifer thermotolerans]|nr:hypothetical protein SAMN05660479_01978 [Microbulbifer thermotolerans]
MIMPYSRERHMSSCLMRLWVAGPTPQVGLSRIGRSGLYAQCATQSHFLLHASRPLAGWSPSERPQYWSFPVDAESVGGAECR